MKKEISKKKLLDRAKKAFFNEKYKEALFYFSLVLKKDPNNKEARIGAILSDMAIDGNDEANALFDYYLLLKKEKTKNPEDMIEELINSLEEETNLVSKILEDNVIDFEEGISYEDFKKLVKNRGSFKRAFEDIMFSTKVIISDKKDFLDFLENLIENGFDEMALGYLEDVSTIYPSDSKIFELFEKIKTTDLHNDS